MLHASERFFAEILRAISEKQSRTTRALAFVGTAKNAGKTTTMNAALDAIAGAPIRPALLSVGVDGESTDALTGGRKPPIFVRSGTLVATAESAFGRSDARFEIVGTLPFRTPLGELVLAEVRHEGHVLLAGLRHRADVVAARDQLVEHGAGVVLIDGAFDRLAAASPEVSDAVIVATGAAVGPDCARVVAATTELVTRLTIARAPLVWRGLTRAANDFGLVLRDDSTLEPLPSSPTANPAVLTAALGRPCRALVLPGLFGDRVADALLAGARPMAVVVPDATHVMCSLDRLERLARVGVEVFVDRAIDVAALTTNPVAPSGEVLDKLELIDAVATAMPDLTVLDVVAGEVRAGSGRR